MPKIKLRPIPEPAEGTRSVLVADRANIEGSLENFRFLRGAPGDRGNVDLVCGAPKCSQKLAAHLKSSVQAQNVVMQCPKCGTFNDTGVPTN